MCKCSGVFVYGCNCVLMNLYMSVEVYWCVGVLACKCTGVFVYGCNGVLMI